MFDWFSNLLLPTPEPDATQSLIAVMLAVGSGVFLGRLRLGKVSLGVSAVMFTGLLLGHLGYRIQPEILHFVRDLGLLLFVYAIGITVGPSFFSSLRSNGLRLNLLAVSTVLLGALVALGLYLGSGLGIENVVGILSGSVTNTPGLGAAKAALQEIQHQFPDRRFVDPAIAYAITYPMGVLGIISVILLSKNLLGIDAQVEMRHFRMAAIKREEPLLHKKCRVTRPEAVGKTIAELSGQFGGERIVISRLKHSGSEAVYAPQLETRLQERDVLMVVGLARDVDAFIASVGRVSTDAFIESEGEVQMRNLFVTKPSAAHRKLAELDLYNRFDLRVTRVYRSGMELLARPSLELFYGDKLRVVGSAQAVAQAEELIGNSEKKLEEPDFLSLFGGLLIGILIGSIPLVVPSLPVPLKLGFAAGPLIAALLISRYGGIGVIHSYFNTGAIHFMKELGICLFFASVGIYAGEHFYENFVAYNGWRMMGLGALVTFLPLLFMVLVGRFVMKLNFLVLAGLMSGTYTDPAALAFSTAYLDSDVPVQSYATVYPLVTIFRIFTAQLLILLFAL
jgi:putative transport protein